MSCFEKKELKGIFSMHQVFQCVNKKAPLKMISVFKNVFNNTHNFSENLVCKSAVRHEPLACIYVKLFRQHRTYR